jgi:hypothetical protein
MLACFASQWCFAQSDSLPKLKPSDVMTGNTQFTVAKAFPNEIATLQQQIVSGQDRAAGVTSLDLVLKCKTNLGGTRQSLASRNHDETDAYINAWAVALRLWWEMSDVSSKQAILNAWNAGLIDSAEVVDQVRALEYVGVIGHAVNRPFLTDEFWNLYAKTHDLELLQAMSYCIAYYGNDQDVQHVKDRLASESDLQFKHVLWLTLSYYDWVKHGQQAGAQPPQILSP